PAARAQYGLRPAQPRLGPLVQRVPPHRLPQRHDLLRTGAPTPRARAVPRQPGPPGAPRPRTQGGDLAARDRRALPAARRVREAVPAAVVIDLVVIGASWGGLTALREVLRALPADFPAAVVVVQHRSARDGMLAALLADGCALSVREAEDKAELRAGAV